MAVVDTWLSEDDCMRLWRVAHGQLPESFATADELDEFLHVIELIAARKMGYEGQTIQ
jgi:hypothetical protein